MKERRRGQIPSQRQQVDTFMDEYSEERVSEAISERDADPFEIKKKIAELKVDLMAVYQPETGDEATQIEKDYLLIRDAVIEQMNVLFDELKDGALIKLESDEFDPMIEGAAEMGSKLFKHWDLPKLIQALERDNELKELRASMIELFNRRVVERASERVEELFEQIESDAVSGRYNVKTMEEITNGIDEIADQVSKENTVPYDQVKGLLFEQFCGKQGACDELVEKIHRYAFKNAVSAALELSTTIRGRANDLEGLIREAVEKTGVSEMPTEKYIDEYFNSNEGIESVTNEFLGKIPNEKITTEIRDALEANSIDAMALLVEKMEVLNMALNEGQIQELVLILRLKIRQDIANDTKLMTDEFLANPDDWGEDVPKITRRNRESVGKVLVIDRVTEKYTKGAMRTNLEGLRSWHEDFDLCASDIERQLAEAIAGIKEITWMPRSPWGHNKHPDSFMAARMLDHYDRPTISNASERGNLTKDEYLTQLFNFGVDPLTIPLSTISRHTRPYESIRWGGEPTFGVGYSPEGIVGAAIEDRLSELYKKRHSAKLVGFERMAREAIAEVMKTVSRYPQFSDGNIPLTPRALGIYKQIEILKDRIEYAKKRPE